MDILAYAMQMEKDGEQFYRDLAGQTSETGLVRILTALADAEVVHYNVLKEMREDGDSALGEAAVLDDARNIFREMMDEGGAWPLSDSQLELYNRALDIESKSRDFYLEKAAAIESASGRDLFLQIADEEKTHYDILDSIVEFVSRPNNGNWLENAEWFHADEY